MKPKALIFYTYLPPWRIDVFNEMGKQYDLTIVFLHSEASGFTYDRESLLSRLNVNTVFWDKGFLIGSKPFRLGIGSLIKKYNPDVVFTHEYSPTSIVLATYLKFKRFSFKLVVTTSDNLIIAKSVGKLKQIFRGYVLTQSTGIIVYSEKVKKWYQKSFPRLKVEVCPNIQNPQTLLQYKKNFHSQAENFKSNFNLGDNIVLYIGRLEHVKGLDLLINAFAKSSLSAYKLVLVGNGSQREELELQAAELGIKDSVIFAGYFHGAELYAWYGTASFFVLPSRYEPFGAVVNEALVFGCPVLTSKNIGALDYIEEGINGYIFDPDDLSDFTSVLKKGDLLSKKTNRENLMPVSFSDYMDAFVNVVK
ncbi:glycosyltransferase [Mucilaginibacter sp. HD30]